MFVKCLFAMLLLLLLAPGVGQAAVQPAPPPIPASFYGTVAGDEPAAGLEVAASINGTAYAQTSLQQVEGEWVYTLKVPADNPSTEAIEGGRAGDEITFLLDGRPVATATWQSGANSRLDLTMSPAAPTVGSVAGGSATSLFNPWLAAVALIAVLLLVVIWQRRRLLAFGR
jgi:hypothetical protein